LCKTGEVFLFLKMKKIKLVCIVVALLNVFGCKKPLEHKFIYGFENAKDISDENIKKTKETINRRLSTLGIRSKIEIFGEDKFKITLYANKLDEEKIDKILVNRGKLEFWHTYEALVMDQLLVI